MENGKRKEDSSSTRTLSESTAIENVISTQGQTQHMVVKDDGRWGWVIVGLIFSFNIILGVNLSGFSVLYVEWVEYFQCDRGRAGWIGSAYIASGNALCVPISIIIERFGTRKVASAGAIICSSGFLSCSFAPSIEVLTVTYGCLAGLGHTLLNLSSAVIIQHYFDRNRAIATGIAFTGLSVGNLICGPFIQVLIDTYGWRGAMMLTSALSLNGLVMAISFSPLQPRQTESKKATHHSLQQTQSQGKEELEKTKRQCCCMLSICDDISRNDGTVFNKMYIINLIGTVFLMLGYAPLGSHTPSRAVSYGIDKHLAALLPTCIGASIMVSRFLFAFVANLKCVNRVLQYGIAITVAGILTLLYTLARTYEELIAFCIVIGLSYGCYLTAQAPMLVDVVGVNKYGRAQAIYNTLFGIGSLICVPAVGYLVDVTLNYELPFYVTGCLLLVGGLIICSSFFLRATLN